MEFCLFVAEKDFNKKKLKRILDRLSYGIKKGEMGIDFFVIVYDE